MRTETVAGERERQVAVRDRLRAAAEAERRREELRWQRHRERAARYMLEGGRFPADWLEHQG